MERLKSRTFWITIAVSIIVALGEQLGLSLDPEQIYSLVGLAGSYILGEKMIDTQRVKAEVNALVEAQVEKLKAEANTIIAGLVERLKAVESVPEAPDGPA